MARLPLPRCPALLFVFLGVHASLLLPGSHGALPSTYDRSMCSESSRCGEVDIRYPFYLSNATKETVGYGGSFSCGYTDLKISCERKGVAEAPIVLLGRDNYTVLNISYDNGGGTGAIILADSDVLGGVCPAVRHNVSFNEGWLYNTSSYYNLTFFFRCNPTLVGTVPGDLAAHRISCPGGVDPFGSSGGGISFVLTTEDLNKALEQELDVKCPGIVTLPIRSEIMTPIDKQLLPGGLYADVLRRGFELGWSRNTTDNCSRCEISGGGGRCAYSGTNKTFLGCLCSDGTTVSPQDYCEGSTSTSKRNLVAIAGGVGGGAAAAFVLAAAVFWFLRMRKQRKGVNSSSKLLKYSGSGGTPVSRGGDMESGSVQDVQAPHFSYEELEEATDCFSEKRELGDGGFGTVYKGYLKDGRVVAVKRLYNNSFRRVEQFVNEAAILSRVRHPNLVMFYGCTSSRSRELLLVYEFVANGTVADHLHGHRAAERALDWPLRLSIAVESAAALTYLHAIEQPIVHRDVKTTNILLDADFHVKVADFGLSRLFPLDATHVSTAPQGTPGYVDPEYHQCYQLTDKSDVYSFGVVLVELISSKPAVDITRHRNEINLAGMAINKIQNSQLEELVDLDLGYDSDPATRRMMTMVAELAFRCLQQNGEMRPPIKEVFEGLKGIQDEYRVGKDGDKDKDHGPFSPNTVHAPWDSRETTPNTSRD